MTPHEEILETIDKNEWLATPDHEKLYSGDNLIDAYLKGRQDGIKGERSLIMDKVKANIKISSNLTNDVFEKMRKMGLNPDSAYLRINDWSKYDILITIPEKEFLDDNILAVYDLLAKIESEFKNEYYSVNISLSDVSASFSEKCVAVDGYGLKHAHDVK